IHLVLKTIRSETGITLLVDGLLAIRTSLTLLIARLICRQGHSGLEVALCTTKSVGDHAIPHGPCSLLRPHSGRASRSDGCSLVPAAASAGGTRRVCE